MAQLPNVRAWFSVDRQTGLPRRLPPGVRLAWLMTTADDRPPRADLIFRVQSLRRLVQKWVRWERGAAQTLVCPTENGVTGHRTSCEQCGICWREPSSSSPGRVSLPVIVPAKEGEGR
jgi:hypothetical protein